ncbi:hypothetical protein B0H13DRAFT_1897440 [Mycena leptocephala]|nr:hypothetical protein B0H13DRAFT_1897440 [Mycena leptocephala]
MSITLPIRALATMQVSLKIGSDGQFGLEMGQASDADYLHAQLDGLKLHLHSVLDSSGVTLTLSVSVEAENGNGRHVAVESCLGPSRTQPALEFSPGAEPLDFFSQLYSVGSSDYPNVLLDYFQAGQGNPGSFKFPETFDAFQLYASPSQTLDTNHLQPGHSNITSADLNLAFETHDYDTQVEMITELPAFDDNQLQDVAASDSDAITSPSECDADYPEPLSSASGSPNLSSASDSPNLSTRGSPCPSDLPCLEPSCSRTFTSKYALSMHRQKHIAKPPPCFPCSGCALQFSRRHDRLRHEVSQHGRMREWECKLCLGFFSSQKTLQKHKCKARRTGR